MITLTFPDGATRQFPDGITGREVAEGIAKSLAKRTVAMVLDGTLTDLPTRSRAMRRSSSSRARTRARSSSSGTTAPTFWPRRCRLSFPARR